MKRHLSPLQRRVLRHHQGLDECWPYDEPCTEDPTACGCWQAMSDQLNEPSLNGATSHSAKPTVSWETGNAPHGVQAPNRRRH